MTSFDMSSTKIQERSRPLLLIKSIIVFAAFLALAGCGSKSDDQIQQASVPVQTQTTAPAAPQLQQQRAAQQQDGQQEALLMTQSDSHRPPPMTKKGQ